MFRSTLLPEELGNGYCGDLRLMNRQVSNMAMLQHAARHLELAAPTKDHGSSTVLAAMAALPLDQFIGRHTLAQFIRAHRGRAGRAEAELKVAADNACSIPRRARFCVACQEEDKAFHGRAYFRRYHQLPGVLWCTKHENAVLHVTPDGGSAYEQPPDFWLKNASKQVASQLRTFATAHQAFLLSYMRVSEVIMAGQRIVDPAKVWAASFAFTQNTAMPITHLPLVRVPKGKVSCGRLLSDLLARRVPRQWLCQLYPSWRMKRLGTPDYIFDKACNHSTYSIAVVVASTVGEQILDDPGQIPTPRSYKARVLMAC